MEDWGGLLTTGDYREMGQMVREAARKNGGGCFGLLEGGYNHRVLGGNVLAFLEGMERYPESFEKYPHFVIPAQAGIQEVL